MKITKPHAVLQASPGMGHLIPVLELGKRLATHYGFNVTVFVVTADPSLSQSQLLNQSSPLPSTVTIVLLPPVDISRLITPTTGILTQLAIMMREAIPSLRSAILNMNVCPTALVVDLFGTEALAVAHEFGMLKYSFITSNAWFLALTLHLPTLDSNVVQDQHVKDRERLVIPGCKSLAFEDTFGPVLDTNDQMFADYVRIGREIPMADGILVNTWHDLEATTLGALGDEKKLGLVAKVPVYPIGPLVKAVNTGPKSEVIGWLDIQPRESVIYVSFGSGGTHSAEQMTEIAWGLELSGQRFIWVVRPPVQNDPAAAIFKTGRRSGETLDYLPDGFLTRTKNTGFVVPMWAPQAEILSHPSVGGFLSHCGWNSALEGMVNGLPMIVWPLFAEQPMNAAMLTEDIGVAVRSKLVSGQEVVGREEIEVMVRTMMEDKDGQRAKAKALKSSAEKALSKGGSSYNSLLRVANDCEDKLKFLMAKEQATKNLSYSFPDVFSYICNYLAKLRLYIRKY